VNSGPSAKADGKGYRSDRANCLFSSLSFAVGFSQRLKRK